MRLSIFDLDHTLVCKNSSFWFCRYLCKCKVFPRSSLLYSCLYYFRHQFLNLSLTKLHEKVFQNLLLGLSVELLERHVEAFLEQYLISYLYEPAVSCLRSAQHLGHYTVILSNSPDFLVRPIAQFFHVNEWKATQYEVDKDNKLCHISSIMQGNDKAEYAVQISKNLGIEKQHVTAYSDSYLDLPFLLAAGIPVAVNPDKKLLSFSKEHNWRVI